MTFDTFSFFTFYDTTHETCLLCYLCVFLQTGIMTLFYYQHVYEDLGNEHNSIR